MDLNLQKYESQVAYIFANRVYFEFVCKCVCLMDWLYANNNKCKQIVLCFVVCLCLSFSCYKYSCLCICNNLIWIIFELKNVVGIYYFPLFWKYFDCLNIFSSNIQDNLSILRSQSKIKKARMIELREKQMKTTIKMSLYIYFHRALPLRLPLDIVINKTQMFCLYFIIICIIEIYILNSTFFSLICDKFYL